MRSWLRLLPLWAVLCCSAALAHRAGESVLLLDATTPGIAGQWAIALHDLAPALQLGALPETQAAASAWLATRPDIAGALLGRLQFSTDGAACRLEPLRAAILQRDAALHLALHFEAHCGTAPRQLALDFHALFEADPRHQCLLKLQVGKRARSAVFTAQSARQVFTLREASLWENVASDLRSGLWHIWTGLDHLLFLLCLLLPVVLLRRATVGVSGARAVLIEVLKVVTAFTLAHSVTLSLAALRILTLPVRFTESVIALSVLFAALLNLVPIPRLRRWYAAFGFGLIHGFAFASALDDLGVSGVALAATLAAFNIGVEIGQLAVVCVFLPLAYVFAGRSWYQPVVLKGGSVAIAVLASLWFIERAFNAPFLPGF